MQICMLRCGFAEPDAMAKTVQIRDLDDDVYDGLRRHAADAGCSVPELLPAGGRPGGQSADES